jgi:membrane-associated phospholipid phosphatase
MGQNLRQNRYFFYLFGLYVFFGAWILQSTSKGEVVLYINEMHNVFLDYFFMYFTHVGDGLTFILLGVLLFFKNRQKAIVVLVCFAITGLTSLLFKEIIFHEEPRPLSFFHQNAGLHFIEGVSKPMINSFPSGHSLQAFSMFLLLAFFSKKNYVGVVCFFLALLVTISRIYLLQHFFVDTYFGALLGVMLTVLVYGIFYFYPQFKGEI